MELSEFSNEFDVYYNNITSNQAPGLDEYEKSVFLTTAQYDVLKAYFDPRKNKVQEGFDDSQQRQTDFSTLIKTITLSKGNPSSKFDRRSVSYRIPNDLFLFVNEACDDNNYRYVVTPISFEEYNRKMLKPYQYPVKRCVWRLMVDSSSPEVSSMTIGDIGKLSISNSSTKDVIFTINILSKKFETVIGAEGYAISIENVGEAPIINESDTSVDIICNISDQVTNTSKYWSNFILKTDREWSDKLHYYVGDMRGDGDSIFPAVSPSDMGFSTTIVAKAATPHIELIGRFNRNALSYTIRYLKRPSPIILTDLEEGLSIQGISHKSRCELDESLHPVILKRAVELAKAAYEGSLQNTIAIGQASQTELGYNQSR